MCGVFPVGEPSVNSTLGALIDARAFPTVGDVFKSSSQWRHTAPCRGDAGIDFYPPFGRERKHERLVREQRAKAVCAACPVTSECLESAMASDERYGVWGGLTFDERISFKRTA